MVIFRRGYQPMRGILRASSREFCLSIPPGCSDVKHQGAAMEADGSAAAAPER